MTDHATNEADVLSEAGQRRREAMLDALLPHVPRAAARRRARRRALAAACALLLAAGATLVTVQRNSGGSMTGQVVGPPPDEPHDPEQSERDIRIARTDADSIRSMFVQVNLGARVEIIDDENLLAILEDDLGVSVGMMRKGDQATLSASDFVREIPLEASG